MTVDLLASAFRVGLRAAALVDLSSRFRNTPTGEPLTISLCAMPSRKDQLTYQECQRIRLAFLVHLSRGWAAFGLQSDLRTITYSKSKERATGIEPATRPGSRIALSHTDTPVWHAMGSTRSPRRQFSDFQEGQVITAVASCGVTCGHSAPFPVRAAHSCLVATV